MKLLRYNVWKTVEMYRSVNKNFPCGLQQYFVSQLSTASHSHAATIKTICNSIMPRRMHFSIYRTASSNVLLYYPNCTTVGCNSTIKLLKYVPNYLFHRQYSQIIKTNSSYENSTQNCNKIDKEIKPGKETNMDEDVISWWNKSKMRQKLLLLFGFCTGVVLGGSLKLGYNYGLYSWLDQSDTGDDSPCLLYDSQSIDTFVPLVNAAKGLNYTQSEENSNEQDHDDNNNTVTGKYGGFLSKFGGKGPPKHKANFNFIADVVERLSPSVVYIDIIDLRRRNRSGEPVSINNGSGFVVDSDGLILTNAHVVNNRPGASRVMVRLHDGRELEGHLEEVDTITDLALVRVNAKGLPAAPLGNSSSLRPGEFVVAVGAPLSLSNTVTAGVVSSTNRCAKDLGIRGNDITYIQTDAAITFGNSGGPLADLDGDVIGINSMKAASGISFAIPVDTAKTFIKKAKGKMQERTKGLSSGPPTRRRYLGITMLSLTAELISELQSRSSAPLPSDIQHGVMVWRVVVGSPAYHAGLQPGDVVTEINGHETRVAGDVYRLLERPRDLTMVVHRGSSRYSVTVTPEE